MSAVRVHLIAALCALAPLAGCGVEPPRELAGLWSAGPAACEAGVGVEFGAHQIDAVYQRQRETLFERPRYQVEHEGEAFRVRIEYDLPQAPGGARSVGAYGVLILERGAGGALKPASHSLIDGRTGAARIRMVGDPAMQTLALRPCGAHPWAEDLRGRAAA